MESTEMDLLLSRFDDLSAGITGVHDRLDKQNGRVRKCERLISGLQWAVYVGGATIAAGVGYLLISHMKV